MADVGNSRQSNKRAVGLHHLIEIRWNVLVEKHDAGVHVLEKPKSADRVLESEGNWPLAGIEAGSVDVPFRQYLLVVKDALRYGFACFVGSIQEQPLVEVVGLLR